MSLDICGESRRRAEERSRGAERAGATRCRRQNRDRISVFLSRLLPALIHSQVMNPVTNAGHELFKLQGPLLFALAYPSLSDVEPWAAMLGWLMIVVCFTLFAPEDVYFTVKGRENSDVKKAELRP
ncbi:hypothetical protein CC2G_013664 [Coprinopsis cinerea AmutBmut pab1-1]|nr:hypothetical protein CC2G_013664 [Coprinopsis cinerea AmutBmut pab1-1]